MKTLINEMRMVSFKSIIATLKVFVGLFIISILTFTSSYSNGQIKNNTQTKTIKADTLKQNHSENFKEEDENDVSNVPGLFGLMGIGLMFLGIGAGIVLTAIEVLLIIGLIGIGIISASVIIGIYYKSVESAIKTFIFSTTTTAGLFVGSIGFWILNNLVHWFTTATALFIGAVGGLLIGFIIGLSVYYVFQKLTLFLKEKYQLK